MRKKKKKYEAENWSAPEEWLVPVDPEQFKFCFNLMCAASSGAMVTSTPAPLLIEGIGAVSLANTPRNRGMLAVNKHLRDVYPPSADGSIPVQTKAIMYRLNAFGDFLCDCLKGKYPPSDKFIRKEGAEVHDALIEAGASAIVNRQFEFHADSIFEIATSRMANFPEDFEQESLHG